MVAGLLRCTKLTIPCIDRCVTAKVCIQPTSYSTTVLCGTILLQVVLTVTYDIYHTCCCCCYVLYVVVVVVVVVVV